MLFDSHAHLDDIAFTEDRDELLAELEQKNIHALIPGTDVAGIPNAIELVTPWEHLSLAVGIHPSEIDQADRLSELEAIIGHPKVRAIGEIGLDYYWVKDNKSDQQELFRQQIQLAKRYHKPVIVHNREAHDDVLKILKEEAAFETGVILHAFSGSAELAEVFINLGALISLAGPVTFKNARVPKEVAQVVPLDRLLVETDSPYLTPHPFRGQRNDPRHLPLIIEQIALLKEVSYEAVAKATFENARRAFGYED